MNIFGIGLPEMGLIMIVALLVFGPKKLPEVGRGVAKTLNELKKASKDFENELKKGTESLEQSVVEPMKATLEEPKVLAANTSKVKSKAENEPMEAEVVEVAAATEPEMPAEAKDLETESETASKTVAEDSAELNSAEQS